MSATLKVLRDTEPERSTIVYQMTGEQITYMLAEERKICIEEIEKRLGLATAQPMTTKAAADFLGLRTPEAVLQRYARGTIRGHKSGGTLYFYAHELNEDIRKKKR